MTIKCMTHNGDFVNLSPNEFIARVRRTAYLRECFLARNNQES